MMPGSGTHGLPLTLDDDQVLTLPFATRYMSCALESRDLCNHPNPNRFNSVCWVDRDDVTPLKAQNAHPGSQVGWHPGFRAHQLSGRSMAMVVLTALQDAIDTWSEITIVGAWTATNVFSIKTLYYCTHSNMLFYRRPSSPR